LTGRLANPLARAILAVAALTGVLSAAASAQPRTGGRAPMRLATGADGELIEVPGATERAELLTFDSGLADALLITAPGEEVTVADWPTAPGERAEVVLTRRDVYASDAAIWEVGADGPRPVPRSRLVFFWGGAPGELGTRAMVSVDPETRELRGLSLHQGEAHELLPTPAGLRDAEGQHLLAPPDFTVDAKGRAEAQQWSCGDGKELPQPFALRAEQEMATDGSRLAVAAAITSLHTATVAFDTDNELMLNKFGNNTTAATNYIASMVAGMNVVYERDLLVRLVQGTTFLRVSTTADPWAPITNTFDGLSQVTTYWAGNQSSVSRAATAMLSGRTSGTSGIAWVDVLCSKSNGYSFTKVASTGTSPSSGDVMVVAHEIGHNFGSPHTHCYNRLGLPLPDQCRSGETSGGGACYTGATSCPAQQTYNGFTFRGSLMSYCHLIGCSTNAGMMVFHPTTVGLLDDKIQARVNQCIFPANVPPPPPTVSGASPASGSTAGGAVVTISGANFLAGATVTVGGTAASSVVLVNATTLRATVPAHAAGAVAVRVTNPSGASGERANTYFYSAPASAGDFYTVTPCRVLDTRNAAGSWGGPALAAGGTRTFTFTGRCGIPSGAKAVYANVTVVSPVAAGNISHFPGNAFPLGTSMLGFRSGGTRAASTSLTLATNGAGTVGFQNASAGTTHLVVDVSGYFQ
jgi:hypothetical protein